jgi:hypothetical protein
MCTFELSSTYGYPLDLWEGAKKKLTSVLWDAARRQTWITYSDAVREIAEFIVFAPDDKVFHYMLGQISVEEDAAGRGMLSALVVHKGGDGQPGPGFFDLADQLGRDTRDRIQSWVKEVSRLFAEAASVPARGRQR